VNKVLIVDDEALVRRGIARLLEDHGDVEVVAEAASGELAVELTAKHKPDVVLMDIHMPGIGGLEATRRLLKTSPATRVIVVSVSSNDPFPSRMLEVGAMGYLTKGCAPEEMYKAIDKVMLNEKYIGSDIAQTVVLSHMSGSPATPFEQLSQRELQVMMMVAQGKKIREISDRLCLSPKTVSTYRYRLFDKLGVQSDVELTHLVMRHGFLAH
jgi:two-component system invasion response regulator UvrY